MKPLVSILIPAYNAQEWIGEALQSALGQTWQHKEIIVVDDGSRDQTLSIARRFRSKDVLVVSQPNQGASAARNHAYSLCQGDFIQWLDADDILATDKIELQLNEISERGSERTLLSGAWGSFNYRIHRARFIPCALWEDLCPKEWLIRKMGNHLHMQPDVWLVSRTVSEAAGPWNEKLWRDNDGEYFCRVILNSDRILFVPTAKSYYRSAGFRRVSYIGKSNRKLESLSLSLHLHIRYLLSMEDSERTREACLRYLQTWIIHFYPYRLDLVEQLQRKAASLGGTLHPPLLPQKYRWIKALFGWRAARETQLAWNKLKGNWVASYDKMMARWENVA